MEFTKDEIDRFFSKIKKLDNGCWEWTSGKYNTGYGMFCAKRGRRKTFGAHRISWMLHNNASILDKIMVCHTCDNKLCVNPNHLYLGTGFENNKDTVLRNRGNRLIGSKCSWAKINENDVREIRMRRRMGDTIKSLSLLYGIDYHAIWDLIHYKNWKHVS